MIPSCLQISLSCRGAPGYRLPIELEEIFTLRQTNLGEICQLVDHVERRGVPMCSHLQTVIQPIFLRRAVTYQRQYRPSTLDEELSQGSVPHKAKEF